MSETILVTGGCGFVGANLLPKLLEQDYRLIVFDNISIGSEHYLEGHNMSLVRGDITDKQRLDEAMQDADYCIHLAAYGNVVDSVDDPFTNFNVNVRGTVNVLDSCVKNNVKKLVFSSTGGAIMGNTPPPVDEATLPSPISPYGASKASCEAYCKAFSGAYGLPTVILRFANAYGPFSGHKKGAATKFVKAVLNDEEITIYGEGTATRDFLYVDDLCDGIVKALQTNVAPASVYHLASGRETSIKELAEKIKGLALNENTTIRYLPERRGEVENTFADYAKAKQELGFEPKWSLEDGFKKTIEWFRDNVQNDI